MGGLAWALGNWRAGVWAGAGLWEQQLGLLEAGGAGARPDESEGEGLGLREA